MDHTIKSNIMLTSCFLDYDAKNFEKIMVVLCSLLTLRRSRGIRLKYEYEHCSGNAMTLAVIQTPKLIILIVDFVEGNEKSEIQVFTECLIHLPRLIYRIICGLYCANIVLEVLSTAA